MSLILFLLLAQLNLHPAMPNPARTPGKTVVISKTALCTTKWGKDVRHVTPKMKATVCAWYGAKNCPGPKWEIDHLVSRELGGADDVANLWPQPIAEARLKDRLENALHKEVCTGRIGLPEAQKKIATDWYAAYKARF